MRKRIPQQILVDSRNNLEETSLKTKFLSTKQRKSISRHLALPLCFCRMLSTETEQESRFKSATIITEKFIFPNNLFPRHKKNVDLLFLEWFVGFSEATGCFHSRIINNETRLCFEIVQTDAKLMYKIRTTLGFGKISSLIYNKQIYWRYTVESKLNLQRIMFLFNGNFIVSKKYTEFKEWIRLGKYILPKNFVLEKQQKRISLNNGWLSGFIEAQGFFYATFRYNTLNCDALNFSQKLIIIQRKTVSEDSFLQEILILFQGFKTVDVVKQSIWYIIELDSLDSQTSLVNYLTNFPFRGNKKITFRRWWRIYLARKTCEVKLFSLKTVEKYQKLCLKINKN